jgi:hypothetical protein
MSWAEYAVNPFSGSDTFKSRLRGDAEAEAQRRAQEGYTDGNSDGVTVYRATHHPDTGELDLHPVAIFYYDPTQDQDLIEMIGARLVKLDPGCDPGLYVDDEPAWDLLVAGDPNDEPNEDWVDVRYGIMDSLNWDGSGDPEWDDPANRGFNIGWNASTPGGRILGQCTPYNCTDRVWTRDRDELWERAEGTLDALEVWVEEKGWEDA